MPSLPTDFLHISEGHSGHDQQTAHKANGIQLPPLSLHTSHLHPDPTNYSANGQIFSDSRAPHTRNPSISNASPVLNRAGGGKPQNTFHSSGNPRGHYSGGYDGVGGIFYSGSGSGRQLGRGSTQASQDEDDQAYGGEWPAG